MKRKNNSLWVGILIILAGISFIAFSLLKMNHESDLQEYTLKAAYKKVGLGSQKDKAQEEMQSVPPPKRMETFQTGDIIGILSIPAIKSDLPIIEGTHEDDLAKGVGHYSTSALPDQDNQILLSGHRDTVFRKLGDLKTGDTLELKMPSQTFSYKIFKSYIVDKDNTTVIRDTSPKEILTLSTCYPFSFVGNAPNRYVIEAERIP
ncbi:sortase A [Peribacillus deserti]|uniref:Sortase A n=1 Tax=Peribacillus deserti TaxID=673318 RepID=A0ABS2QF07_9BACI|nr:class D sortase [Peribacillus deserti]MBM7690896.1 sortase A [Peribacillus deserti]